jgi:hypothetical protein
MDVRKEVNVSPYSAGTGESFVEGFLPRDMGRAASSFDALSVESYVQMLVLKIMLAAFIFQGACGVLDPQVRES